MKNIPLIFGIIFIFFLVGSAYSLIGDVVCEDIEVGEVFEWYFPLAILGLTGIPFFLGYHAGQEDIKNE